MVSESAFARVFAPKNTELLAIVKDVEPLAKYLPAFLPKKELEEPDDIFCAELLPKPTLSSPVLFCPELKPNHALELPVTLV